MIDDAPACVIVRWERAVKILYVFPHPDDESFGPARAISAQVRAGHAVYLLTLTKGGATKERFRLGYSVEQMGETRYREMQDVAKVLRLADLTVPDLPDSGLFALTGVPTDRILLAPVASQPCSATCIRPQS